MAAKRRRRKQGYKQKWKKGVSAVLLVLLFLAFFVIKAREKTPQQALWTEQAETGKTQSVPLYEENAEAGNEKDSPASGTGEFSLDLVPAYSGQAYTDINGDVPFFTEEEMTRILGSGSARTLYRRLCLRGSGDPAHTGEGRYQ